MKRKIYTLVLAAASVFAMSSCGDEEVSSVAISSDAITLFTGETSSLSASVSPSDADNKNIEWSSSDASVITVDADGNLAAVKPGTVTITAKAHNGRSAACEVTVKNGFVFDTERKAIVDGVYGNYTEGETGRGFQFWFYTNDEEDGAFDQAAEFIWIDIPNEMMGETFELTEENLYDWGWWIEYTLKSAERTYQGFGDEGQMEDVESGTMRADIIGENSFKVTFNITFTDGKKLKGAFVGALPEDTSYYDGGRAGRKSPSKKGNL